MRVITTATDEMAKMNIINKDMAWDVPGGISQKLSTLPAGKVIPEGTPVGVPTSGIRNIIKQGFLLTGSTATALKVNSATNLFIVGDVVTLGVGKAASAITAIVTADGIDTMTVVTVGTVATGDAIYLALTATTGTDSALFEAADVITKFPQVVPSAAQVFFAGGAYTRANVIENVIGAENLATLPGVIVVKY